MNKIDFAIVILAQHCNPNGDPLNNNRPRQDYEGHGYITDVCLKHKIRNRLMDFGENILMVENTRVTDGLYSVYARVKEQPSLKKLKDPDLFYKEVCKIWIDVRTFGQVFAFKDKDTGGVSMGVRGPVSIGDALSLDVIDIIDVGVTKSTNLVDTENNQKDSATMGAKYIIDRGVYVAYGSISTQLASLTGFNEKDADILKNAMATILENDSSSARPSGSMGSQLFWWEHDCPMGRKNSLYVHRSLHIQPKDEFPYYTYDPETISGITLSII